MKPIWKSRTFWANALGAGAWILNGPLGHVVPPEALGLTVAVVNIALRFITDEPVSLTGR